MAQRIVFKLNEELVRRLQLRATQNGRSVEAEHRAILQAVLMDDAPMSFKDWLLSLSELGIEFSGERDRADKGRNAARLFN